MPRKIPLTQVLAVATALAVGLTNLVGVAAAQADPSSMPAATDSTLVGFGSPASELVMNKIAAKVNTDAGSRKLASYDSTGSSTVITRTSGNDIPRANSASEALQLLNVAKGRVWEEDISTPAGEISTPNAEVADQVSFARSALPPAASGIDAADPNGVWSYVPFARDSVAIASNPATVTNNGVNALSGKLVIGSAEDAVTVPSLYNIYRCRTRYVYVTATGGYVGVGATSTPLPTGAARAVALKPLLPDFASNSELRTFFVTNMLGFTQDSADIPAKNEATSCVSSTYRPTTGGAQQAINEVNSGAALAAVGAGALVPYSVGSWISQSRSATTGVRDARSGAVLLGMSVGGTATPAVLANGDASASFPVSRTLFNIVPFGRVTDSLTPEFALFFGKNSSVCAQDAIIKSVGLIPLLRVDSPTSIADCGYTGFQAGARMAPPVRASLEYRELARGEDQFVNIETTHVAGLAKALYLSYSSFGYSPIVDAEAAGHRVDAGDFGARATFTTGDLAANYWFPQDGCYLASFTADDESMFLGAGYSSCAASYILRAAPYTVQMSDIPDRVNRNSSVAVRATITPPAGGELVGGTVYLIDQQGNDLAVARAGARASQVSLTWIPQLTASVRLLFVPEGASASLNALSDPQAVWIASYTPTISASQVSGWDSRTGYFGETSFLGVASLKMKIAVIKETGGTTPTGTVTIRVSDNRTGGALLTAYPVRLGADGTAVVTVPPASKWRTDRGSGGVLRYLNISYSGDGMNYAATATVKVYCTR